MPHDPWRSESARRRLPTAPSCARRPAFAAALLFVRWSRGATSAASTTLAAGLDGLCHDRVGLVRIGFVRHGHLHPLLQIADLAGLVIDGDLRAFGRRVGDAF